MFESTLKQTTPHDAERMEAVVQSLALASSKSDSLEALTHDARNMVTALGLYCELLENPGVLNPTFHHYSSELRLLTAACRRLVEKLVVLDFKFIASDSNRSSSLSVSNRQSAISNFQASNAEPIANLALELRTNRNLLAALAGPGIKLHLSTTGAELPVRLTSEDLTRILVNLVKNSAEALDQKGEIELNLRERITPLSGGHTNKSALTSTAQELLLTVTDNGPGIRESMTEAVFTAGFTTHVETDPDTNWQGQHRGLGLAITRAILESVGGSICAVASSNQGACFEISLPVDLARLPRNPKVA